MGKRWMECECEQNKQKGVKMDNSEWNVNVSRINKQKGWGWAIVNEGWMWTIKEQPHLLRDEMSNQRPLLTCLLVRGKFHKSKHTSLPLRGLRVNDSWTQLEHLRSQRLWTDRKQQWWSWVCVVEELLMLKVCWCLTLGGGRTDGHHHPTAPPCLICSEREDMPITIGC